VIPLTGEYGGSPLGAYATGTTNWSLYFGTLEAGAYLVVATSQDGAGNLSTNAMQEFTVLNPPPGITGISVSGTTLTLTATNGVAGGQYLLLTSTNIAAPFSQWTKVLTNNFDLNGNLNLSTNILSRASPRQFFVLSQ
jgi:hypothetical protein